VKESEWGALEPELAGAKDRRWGGGGREGGKEKKSLRESSSSKNVRAKSRGKSKVMARSRFRQIGRTEFPRIRGGEETFMRGNLIMPTTRRQSG